MATNAHARTKNGPPKNSRHRLLGHGGLKSLAKPDLSREGVVTFASLRQVS
jgi:hypothetical protein